MNRATFAQHTDNLGLLRDLVDALDRHKEISKAHEESLKLLKVTDEEIQKKNQLKELIEKNTQQLLDIENEKNGLVKLRSKTNLEVEDLEKQKKLISENREKVLSDDTVNKSFAARNEDLRAKLEAESSSVAKTKSEYEDKLSRLDEKEKSLDLRAEKILLREKASEL